MAFSDKAAVPGVNRNHVHEAIIRWPVSIVEQKRIAGILGALDDKIDLNRRMSQTLESMARALFRSWFVDFDPVRAKAEGRDPSLTSAFADLFPDSLIDSELGEIPYGWGVAPLGDLVELAYGKALRSQDRRPGFVPVYGSNGQVGWHDEALALGPGVVVGRKGTPGTVEWSARDFYVIDTAFYVVRKCPALTLPFLFHALQCQDLAALGADSAVPGLNRNLAYMSSQIVPPRPLVEAFGELALSLSRRGDACDREAASLESTREALIPWLLNSSSIGAATAMPRTGGTT
jgi:type I restriction enzyme S subunit